MLYSPGASQPCFQLPQLDVAYFLGLVFPNVQKGQGCSKALVFHDRGSISDILGSSIFRGLSRAEAVFMSSRVQNSSKTPKFPFR